MTIIEDSKAKRKRFLAECEKVCPHASCTITRKHDLDYEWDDEFSGPEGCQLEPYCIQFNILTVNSGQIRNYSDQICGVLMEYGDDIGDVNGYLWDLAYNAADAASKSEAVRCFTPDVVTGLNRIKELCHKYSK